MALIGPRVQAVISSDASSPASPTSGCVLLGNVSIAMLGRCVGSRRIGYLPQDIELFSGAIR